MSDDLISRKALLEDFRNTITENSDTFDWLNMISRQPVAYDAGGVLEQLENLRDRFDLEDFHIRGILEKVIEIVKSGGVSDD